MNLDSGMSAFLEKPEHHSLRWLSLEASRNLLWDVWFTAQTPFNKVTYLVGGHPLHLFGVVLRVLWETDFSWVIILGLQFVKFSISFLDWLLINFIPWHQVTARVWGDRWLFLWDSLLAAAICWPSTVCLSNHQAKCFPLFNYTLL